MRIIVTGHTGFTGKAITAHLASRGHEIIGVSRSILPASAGIQTLTWKELEKAGEFHGIIHLAGRTDDTPDKGYEQDYQVANVDLTKKIYNIYLTASASFFIHFSSVKAVTGRSDGPVDETVEPAPLTAYGRSKRMAEEWLLNNPPGEGKSLVILRPAMVCGPGMKGNLPRLFSLLRKGYPWLLGNNTNRRSILSLKNLLFIIEKLIEKPADKSIRSTGSAIIDPESGYGTLLQGTHAPVFLLADDNPLTMNEILSIAGDVIGRKVTVWPVPERFINFAAGMGTKLHLPFNENNLQKLTGNLMVSNHKIRQYLNIRHLPCSSEETLYETFQSLLNLPDPLQT